MYQLDRSNGFVVVQSRWMEVENMDETRKRGKNVV
jgi:hypothetical protein